MSACSAPASSGCIVIDIGEHLAQLAHLGPAETVAEQLQHLGIADWLASARGGAVGGACRRDRLVESAVRARLPSGPPRPAPAALAPGRLRLLRGRRPLVRHAVRPRRRHRRDPDAGLRLGGGPADAAAAGALPGADDRRLPRCRARQDPARVSARRAGAPGGHPAITGVLRQRRRDHALPHPAGGVRALVGRSRPGPRAAPEHRRRAQLDGARGRLRRRRLSRLSRTLSARPRQSRLEGFRQRHRQRRRLAAGAADRALRGAGVRVPRVATDGRAAAQPAP